jgi:hypothetical protein
VGAFGHPTLCAVSALLHIVERWNALGLPKEHPLAIYTTNGTINGTTKLIHESNINAALQNAACNVYNVKGDNLDRFTLHSIRVGACVALHAANILALNIQHALHWKSDAFLIYLRNLPCQAQRTARAVIEFNPTASTLCWALRQHSCPFIPTIHCLFHHACPAMTTEVSSFLSPVYMHVPTLCALLWWQHSHTIYVHNCLLHVFIFLMKPFTLIEYHVPRSRCQWT